MSFFSTMDWFFLLLLLLVMLFSFKYRCDVCDKLFSSRYGRKKHMKNHFSDTDPTRIQKFLSCDICMKKFTTKIGLNRHLDGHSIEGTNTGNDPHTRFIAENFDMTCDLCEAVFISFHDARNHYRDVHKEKKGYIKCCQMKLREIWIITDHINSHLNPNNFKYIRNIIHILYEFIFK